MDIYARARTLESAVGLPKWSLSRRPAVFLAEGPTTEGLENVDPEWFARRDTGFSNAVYDGAYSVLKAETGRATAEEVAQNMVGGISTSGNSKQDIYGYLGKRNKGPILSGRKTPKSLKSILFGYAKDKAIDEFRVKMTEKRNREKTNPSLIGPESLREAPGSAVVVDRSPQEVMFHLISSPAGRPFRNWIDQTIRRKATEVQVIIYDVYMDHLARTGEWPSASKIQDKVIEAKGSDISVTKINQHRRKFEALISREMKNNPKILDWVDRYLDLAQLGYGGGSLRAAKRASRLARMASKVADRYLGIK